jgi:subtilisin family serine protease
VGQFRTSWSRRITRTGIATGAAAAVVAALATGTAAAAPEGQILGLDAAEPVQDSYIVVLKPRSDVSAAAADLANEYGAAVKHTYRNALQGFSATMSEKQARRLAADPAVDHVEQDARVHTADTQENPPSWGLDRIDQKVLPLDSSYTYATDASNVTAYIIDTGILTTHDDFGGRASHGYDAVDDDNDATDCAGHGTHVAGTVGGSSYGVAKGVKLVAVRVLNCSGSGTFAGVIAGIDWVTANAVAPAVANMSLGGGASATVDAAVQRSIAAGVTYGIAGGNNYSASACNYSPARTPEAITVGATESSDAKAAYSNIGSCLDIFAPGSAITSAWHTGTTATNTISGTSMATPHVVGAAALYLAANPTATPQQVRDALVEAATSGVVTGAGSGSPNELLYVGDGSDPDPEPPTFCTSATNTTATPIPDLGTVTSDVVVSGCEGAASTGATVEVHATHTYRGDLVIDLITPRGVVRSLKAASSDSGDGLDETFTVNLASEPADGTWQLRVRDAYAADSGTLTSWTLTL